MNEMPTRWSYSSLSTYESCPAKWRYGYLLGVVGEPSPAMARGSRLHADCESYVKGDLQVVPWELKKVALKLEDYRQKGAKAEETWLLDKTWKPDVFLPWIKAIIDVHYVQGKVLYVCDYKSGREYPEHREQLELYALMGLCYYPDVVRAEYKALYLDTGHESNEGAILRGGVMESRIEAWTNRAIRIFEDKQYLPRPSTGACRFCDAHKKNGGPCEAGI